MNITNYHLRIIAHICILMISSCSNTEKKNVEQLNKTQIFANEKKVEKDTGFSDIHIDIPDTNFIISRKDTPYKGVLKFKGQWKDREGLNRLIISSHYNKNDRTERNEIFGYQYTMKKNEWKRLWQFNDYVDGIGCDLHIDLKQTTINDIDSNGIAEALILYTLDNRCDAVGVATKLLLFVEGKKIAVRGISSQYLMPTEEIYNKVMNVSPDKPFKYKDIAPGAFSEETIYVKFASKAWDNFILKENQNHYKNNKVSN